MITTENDMNVLPEKISWQFHHKNKYSPLNVSVLYFVCSVKCLGKLRQTTEHLWVSVCKPYCFQFIAINHSTKLFARISKRQKTLSFGTHCSDTLSFRHTGLPVFIYIKQLISGNLHYPGRKLLQILSSKLGGCQRASQQRNCMYV